MMTLSVRLDFGASLVLDRQRARRVAEILNRPCFSSLERVSAHRGDRWLNHAQKSADRITEILGDPSNSAVSLDSKRGGELLASAELKSGSQVLDMNPAATKYSGYLAFPPTASEPALPGLLELALALDVGAGFIAAEPDHLRAQDVALGGSRPKARPGLSTEQARERRGRDWHKWQIHRQLAGIEWGTFLGREHIAQLDLAALRQSGAFFQVLELSPQLVFLQLTGDPADDLREDFEPRRQRAREALAPLLMDLSDVTLD